MVSGAQVTVQDMVGRGGGGREGKIRCYMGWSHAEIFIYIFIEMESPPFHVLYLFS